MCVLIKISIIMKKCKKLLVKKLHSFYNLTTTNMACAFVEFPSTFGKKITYKVANGGYTYSRRKVSKNKSKKYYYCDNRGECNATIIWTNGKWSYGSKGWNA
ncbi:unnamed protein product [Orchesella dallaii]|uniref:FLYWCH-type domain-containing protein n=1 Tax=Orchesella dallaii TaxID=48710 RepID=A0ABP1QXT0_9HEXA